MSAPNVYRDKIQEARADYFVSYQPADARFSFALLDLVFPESQVDVVRAAQAMEEELEIWLRRFAVPVMVSAFNGTDDLVRVHGESGESHLMGFCDPKTGQLVRGWRLLKDEELPAEQTVAEHLHAVYRDVGFREQRAVRDAAQRETKNIIRAGRAIVFFVIAVPVLIEAISLGVAWVGHILAAISITAGVYRAAKAFGWLKPTERERVKADEERKMKHYYWHCERNPEAFNRLKIQNFEREAMERTRREAESLGMKMTSKSSDGPKT